MNKEILERMIAGRNIQTRHMIFQWGSHGKGASTTLLGTLSVGAGIAFPERKVCGRGILISDTDTIAAWRKRHVAGGIHENASAPPHEARKSGKRKGNRI